MSISITDKSFALILSSAKWWIIKLLNENRVGIINFLSSALKGIKIKIVAYLMEMWILNIF